MKHPKSSPLHGKPGKRRVREAPIPPFVFADHLIAPGKTQRFEVPVARLPTGTFMSLPMVVMHGARPGPTLWLSAALHGDEINGVIIVDELVRRLQPAQLSGTVLAVPVVNVFGLIQGSRYLPDRRDLNRCFPGSKRGSLGSQLAHLLSELVIERSDVGIDFHTGSGGRMNLPQIRGDLDDPRVVKLARAFGAPAVVHSAVRDGSLRAHAIQLGKPVLLYEAGEANRLDDAAIQSGIDGSLRVMASIGMIQERPERSKDRVRAFRSRFWIRAPRSGFLRMSVKLGDAVQAGQVIALVVDPALGTRTPIKTKKAGVLIGQAADGLATAGDAIAHIAENPQSLRGHA